MATFDNFTQFDASVRRFASKLGPDHVVPFHKKLTLELLGKIVKRNPVDTGRSRGNWQTTIGQPAEGEIDEEVAKSRGVGAARTAGLAALTGLQPFKVSFLTNNVPYILPLENGHSKRAPSGMVKLSLEEMQQAFEL